MVASETPGERSPRRASAEPAAATRWRQSAAQRGRDRGCRCRGRRGAAGRAVPTPRGGSSPPRDACQCQADAGQGRERRAGTRRGCDVPGPGGGGAPGATASLRKPGGARGAHAASGGPRGARARTGAPRLALCVRGRGSRSKRPGSCLATRRAPRPGPGGPRGAPGRAGQGPRAPGWGVPAAGRGAGARGPGAATVVQARPAAVPATPGSEARWARSRSHGRGRRRVGVRGVREQRRGPGRRVRPASLSSAGPQGRRFAGGDVVAGPGRRGGDPPRHRTGRRVTPRAGHLQPPAHVSPRVRDAAARRSSLVSTPAPPHPPCCWGAAAPSPLSSLCS